MGRRKVIDREMVLEAAERIVGTSGASGLTFEAVATAAGITKGGVQSCFGSKEALIDALLRRWGALYAADVARRVAPDADPLARARAHVRSTAEADDAASARAAGLLAALLQSPEHLGWIRGWYAERFRDLDAIEGTEGDRARVAFLAAEGLFFLRHLGLADMGRTAWERHFEEVAALLASDAGDEDEPGGRAPAPQATRAARPARPRNGRAG